MSFDAIGIASKDLVQSVKFYKLLGVELAVCGGSEHYEGTTTGGVRIMMDSVKLLKELNPLFKESSGGGITLCFKQSSPKLVDEVHGNILAAGFKEIKAPWDAFWGQRYSSVADPDGNQIDLFAEL